MSQIYYLFPSRFEKYGMSEQSIINLYLWKNIIACKDEMKNRSSQDLGSIKIIKYSSNASVYYAWRVCSTLPILFLLFLEIHLFMKIFGVKGHAGDKKMCPLGMDRLSVPPR